MALNTINAIGSVGGAGAVDPSQFARKSQAVDGKDYPSFKDTLSSFMGDVNDLQKKADVSIQKLVAGEITDVHQVMASANEAGLAFNMMMEIRNKVMDAYTEVMRMRL